ncbi:phosphoribosylamine--glycine ligase [Candidatus Kinetoplastidibacterium crithidiae]|uniref:Phosphoribosylamine--glycine ligase n=1 Tax=Candidatus Kinetoplastidibacterium crithidiae TCC036E TaxID=1208918 RepID=M1LW72_9PROT|nr:phosphoribosylamine--glycine ligase [Candidatus Kinetoplastibacterium crithidii]AFZ82854.1 phosphoribosylamine--glycine ligase [Candidatus Kinetoplastibacterium crithidii (ex Angomonas deanei ATCC 30255)]AGF47494.1 phosphoribosylamine--glycine ligase [Candidatus Kinetoplastibacterium crithidii TCC036E]
MKILIIGSGGREHALAWKIAQSSKTTQVYVAPGNGGTSNANNIKNIQIENIDELAKFAEENNIKMTIVGPEVPLAEGIVDKFMSKDLRIFGPTKSAARLESSKKFAKDFMSRHSIPTAKYATFTNIEEAISYLETEGAPIVIKADGLASGKGVVVAETLEEAKEAVIDMISKKNVNKLIIEEYLTGEEASFIVMSDGINIMPLATSQDHKRLKDGDQGPNTGGMGAYSPANIVTPDLHNRIMKEIIVPTIQGMAKDGIPYTGFLYAGVMISPGENPERPIKTLEFNCRMGDPETQPIMMRMKSDFVDVLEHALNGSLDKAEIIWDRRVALGVVLASYNYPESPRKNDIINGIPNDKEDCITFHAATKISSGKYKTDGGRVLCVTTLGDSVRIARETAYKVISNITFDGMQYRSDIGWRSLKSNSSNKSG